MRSFFLITVLCVLGCSKNEDSQVLTPQPTNRFELTQLGSFRRDQYLLDKQTGQLWSNTCLSSTGKNGPDCDYSAWMKVDVESLNGISRDDIYAWAKALEERKKSK